MLRGAFSRVPWCSPFNKVSPVCRPSFSPKFPLGNLTRIRGYASHTKLPDNVMELTQYTPDKIRNFCIIAHIDHGKTTLSTKILTMTGTISDNTKNVMYLDKLQVEKERGITVKAQTCTILYPHTDGTTYLVNLIDTPGHVDFNYEVTRSLMACQGALLVVDAAQGIQAQTLANFWLAFEQNLTIIPAINKIDLPNAIVPIVTQQMQESFDAHPDDIILMSAKTGLGVDKVLPRVIDLVPPPEGSVEKPLKAMLLDNWFDTYRGVVCLLNIKDGKVAKGDKIVSSHFNKEYDVVEVGIMYPEPTATDALYPGQVGYIYCGMKSTQEARIGDTFYIKGAPVEPLPGFKAAKPMVYAGIYPVDSSEFEGLKDAVEKLILTDASVPIERENSMALGMGFRCGFLGMLHMDVFLQRLKQEFQQDVLSTPPSVPYKITLRDDTEIFVSNPSDYPPDEKILRTEEPYVEAAIVAPSEYMGAIMTLCNDRRGKWVDTSSLGERVRMQFSLPLSEVIHDFFDTLKQITSGYASFEYEEGEYREVPLVKVVLMVNGEPVDALSVIVVQDKAYQVAKKLVDKLKEVVERQLFTIAIQAAIGSKVIARETVSAHRKDVTAKCYGGDITRKRKLLDKQKEGKKRMKQMGSVELPAEAFMELLKR